MSASKYFYMASIKQATSVNIALKANFTQTPLTEEEIEQQAHKNQGRGDRQATYKIDQNLILAKSNILSVQKLTETGIDQLYELALNDQIISILKIPTSVFYSQRAGEQGHDDHAQDLIYVLTAEFHCILLGFSISAGIIELSTGVVQDHIGQKKEPPYSVFLGSSGKFICLMLYENIIKIIPLLKSGSRITMSNAFNIRIRHPDVKEIMPLYEFDSIDSKPVIAVFYSQQFHRGAAQGNSEIQLQLKRYELNTTDKDIESSSNEDILTFESTNVYKVFPLDFGGFLAFEPDCVHCYKKRIKSKVITKKLRKPVKVKAITKIDTYNPDTKLTTTGNNVMRYLFATESGEIYMMAFFLNSLNLITGIGSVNLTEANAFFAVEFLGSKLSNCSSLEYLENGYIYYGSRLGQSMLIQLQTQNQGNPDQPYITIVQKYNNLGPVQDLVIKNPHIKKGQQHELFLVGGTGHNSHISVIKKGISIKTTVELDNLPALMPNGLFQLSDKILMKFFGIDQLVMLQIINQNSDMILADCETPKLLHLEPHVEILLSLQETIINDSKINILATNRRLRLINADMTNIIAEYLVPQQSSLTHISIRRESILISIDEGQLIFFNILAQSTIQGQVLMPSMTYKFQSDISALALSESSDFACIALYDAPLYSLVVLNPMTMSIIAKRSAAFFLDEDQTRNFSMNQEIKSGSQKHEESDLMQIETASQSTSISSLNSFYPVNAVCSLQIVSINEQDFIICGMSDGKLLQICLDTGIAKKILNEPESFPPQLNIMFDPTFEDIRQPDVPSVLWNIQVSSIGEKEVTLHKLDQSIVIACSDKPTIFFQTRDTLTMQYLNYFNIQQVISFSFNGKSLLAYENSKGNIVIGELDSLQQLQMSQMHFTKEITKSINLPDEDGMVVLMEEPDFAYLDKDSPATNTIALLNKTSLSTLASYSLQKAEVSNCMLYCEKKVQGQLAFSNKNSFKLVLVGTSFMDLDETLPTRGRLIILEVSASQAKLNHIHLTNINGSIQAIATIKDDHKYLILGINNEIHLYAFNLKNGPHFQLDKIQEKTIGTFIQEIKVIQNTIIVADIMKGIMLYDFKEGRVHANKYLTESAHTNHSIWTNCVLPLNLSQFILFDKEKNLFLFERILLPTNDQEKFKLNLIGCIRVGEEVTKAVFGSLNINQSIDADEEETKSKQGQKAKSYLTGKTRQSKKKPSQETKDVIMSQADQVAAEEIDEQRLRSDKDYVRQICQLALKDVKRFKSGQNIIYGTQEGSLGALIEIPERAYKFLDLVIQHMEKVEISQVGKIGRKDYRTVKIDSLKRESFNIIDGTFIELFLSIDLKQQTVVIQNLLHNSKDYSNSYLKDVKALIETLRDKH